MADLPTENKDITTVNTVAHAAIFDVALNLAEKAIYAEVPFLAFPVIKQIVHFCFNYLANKMYVYLAHLVAFNIVDSQVNNEVKAVKAATEALDQSLKNGEGNEEAKKKALDEYKRTLVALINFDGASRP